MQPPQPRVVSGESPEREICGPLNQSGAASGDFRAMRQQFERGMAFLKYGDYDAVDKFREFMSRRTKYGQLAEQIRVGVKRIKFVAPHKMPFGTISGPSAPGPLWKPLQMSANRGYQRAKVGS